MPVGDSEDLSPVRVELRDQLNAAHSEIKRLTEEVERLMELDTYTAELEALMPSARLQVREAGLSDSPLVIRWITRSPIHLVWRGYWLSVLSFPQPLGELHERVEAAIRLVKLADDIGYMIRREELEREVFLDFSEAGADLLGQPKLVLVCQNGQRAGLRALAARTVLEGDNPLQLAGEIIAQRARAKKVYEATGRLVDELGGRLKAATGGRKQLMIFLGCPYADDIVVQEVPEYGGCKDIARIPWSDEGIQLLTARVFREEQMAKDWSLLGKLRSWVWGKTAA